MKAKIAIVTGGAGDIGQAISLRFCKESITPVIIDIDPQKGQYFLSILHNQQFKAHYYEADVSNFSASLEIVENISTTIGEPSILVNCAGIIQDSSIINMKENNFNDVLNVNLKGAFNYIKAVAPIFKRNNYGKIVNISSINALRGKFGQCNYTASKAGLIGLSKTLAIELGKYNINVNVVAPGMISTKLTKDLPENIINKAINETVLGRIGNPEDVANLVYFLVTDQSKHITGQTIVIDGGQYL